MPHYRKHKLKADQDCFLRIRSYKDHPYVPDDVVEEKEFKDAQEIISQSFEPYDVTKDLGFDEET